MERSTTIWRVVVRKFGEPEQLSLERAANVPGARTQTGALTAC